MNILIFILIFFTILKKILIFILIKSETNIYPSKIDNINN